MRRTAKRYKRLSKRLECLFRLLEENLGDWRHRQAKTRLREVMKLVTVLNHPGWRQP